MDESSLRAVFDRLAAGETASLPPDLDPPLVAEALVGYADTTSLPVAEHLQEFVVGVTSGSEPDLAHGFELLGSVPAVPVEPGLDSVMTAPDDDLSTPEWAADVAESADEVSAGQFDLDFGSGTLHDPGPHGPEAHQIDSDTGHHDAPAAFAELDPYSSTESRAASDDSDADGDLGIIAETDWLGLPPSSTEASHGSDLDAEPPDAPDAG